MREKATGYTDELFSLGFEVHVIVNETEKARAYADGLLSKLDLDLGNDLRNRSRNAASLGVARQSQLREQSDDKYYVDPTFGQVLVWLAQVVVPLWWVTLIKLLPN